MPASSSSTSSSSTSSPEGAAGDDGDPVGPLNLAVVVGRLSRPPVETTLQSGTVLVRYEVTVRPAGEAAESMPVVWFDPPARAAALAEGAVVAVVGRVRRRFYRGAGRLQSSTEIVASAVAPVTHRTVRAKAAAVLRSALGPFEGPAAPP